MPAPLVQHPGYDIPWRDDHPFPMAKFRLLRELVIAEGIAGSDELVVPAAATDEQLGLVHTAAYLAAFRDGAVDAKAWRATGVPWSEDLVARSVIAVGGTLTTARLALEHGAAANLAGGTHHAFADRGAGYCLLNDLAVTAATLLAEGAVRRVCVLDCDVHQGDGTAAIFATRPEVFTCSLHCGENYPRIKQRSDLDVALPRGIGDAAYLDALREAVTIALERSRPDLVLYDAGVDPHRDDRLGHLALSDAGLAARDEHVIANCLARDIPVACVIGGGYDRDPAVVAARHAILPRTLRALG